MSQTNWFLYLLSSFLVCFPRFYFTWNAVLANMFLFDWSRQTKIHNIGATLVGVDKFGNKYYEKLEDTQFG